MDGLLIANGTVVTLGASNRVLPGHDVLCEGGRIAAVGPTGSLGGGAARRLDAGGMLVMPGFINAHMHFYSTFARGLGKAPAAASFREVLDNLWWRLDRALEPEDCALSTAVAGIEAIRHGTTCLIDHHASPKAVAGSLDAVAEAIVRLGLRACLSYEISDRDGEAVAAAGLEENERFALRCRGSRDEHLRAMVGLHASFTLSDGTLEAAADLAARQAIGCHVHVAEAASDQQETLARHGVRVVERFRRAAVLGPRTLAVHCVHVDEEEIGILAATGATVVHNPQSNMNNAVGVADVLGMRRAGVAVALGTDAMTTDMLAELRAALFVRHLVEANPSVGFTETVSTLLTANGALASHIWGMPLGRIETGAAADLAVIDYRPATPLDEGSFAGHLVFGVAHARVDATVVAGRVLMERGRLMLDIDEEQLAAHARERAKIVWERF